jgi:hypothetical protein
MLKMLINYKSRQNIRGHFDPEGFEGRCQPKQQPTVPDYFVRVNPASQKNLINLEKAHLTKQHFVLL